MKKSILRQNERKTILRQIRQVYKLEFTWNIPWIMRAWSKMSIDILERLKKYLKLLKDSKSQKHNILFSFLLNNERNSFLNSALEARAEWFCSFFWTILIQGNLLLRFFGLCKKQHTVYQHVCTAYSILTNCTLVTCGISQVIMIKLTGLLRCHPFFVIHTWFTYASGLVTNLRTYTMTP